jgi:hypothetical protein
MPNCQKNPNCNAKDANAVLLTMTRATQIVYFSFGNFGNRISQFGFFGNPGNFGNPLLVLAIVSGRRAIQDT